jgi:hypothetical protein
MRRSYRPLKQRRFRRWLPNWRMRLQARCPHPVTRRWGGVSGDGVRWEGCCACGSVFVMDWEYGRKLARYLATRKTERNRTGGVLQ